MIPALTGIRGLSALMIMISHYLLWCAPYPPSNFPSMLGKLDLSELAMSVFFTLSGFVLAYNYCNLPWRKLKFEAIRWFIWQRFSRLYPAYVIFLLFAAIINAEKQFDWISLHIFSVQSWYPFTKHSVLAMNSTFHVSWSISTEWGLYLFFIPMMMITNGLKQSYLLLTLLILVFFGSIYFFIFHFDGILLFNASISEQILNRWYFYVSPWWRIFDFSTGIALFILTRKLNFYSFKINFQPIIKIFETKTLLFMGEISYSLYLFHFMTPRFNFGQYDKFSSIYFIIHLTNILLTSTCAILFSFGAYKLIEIPCQNFLRNCTIAPKKPSIPVDSPVKATIHK